MDICNNGSFLEIMRILRIIFDILKIAIPLVLIVLIMIDLFKTITNDREDAINEAVKIAVRRIIAAIMIFLVPTIVEVVSGFIGGKTIFECIANANKEGVSNAYAAQAKEHLDTATSTLDIGEYELAVKYSNKITDEELKKEISNGIDNISDAIEIKMEIENLPGERTPERYDEIKEEISALTNESYKNYLLKLLDAYYNSGTSIPDIDEVEIVRLNVEAGVKTINYSGQTITKYHIIIPNDAMSNMPLIIFLHGDGQQNRVDNLVPFNYVKDGNAYGSGKFIFIAPVAKQDDWIVAANELKSLIDSVVSEYKINKQKIIITGFSRGSIGTWYMVYKNPKYFSAAAPISCSAEFNYNKDYSNFIYTPIWAMENTNVGDPSGCYHLANNSDIQKLVNGINNNNGNAKLTLKDTNHSGMQSSYRDNDLYAWMLSQTNQYAKASNGGGGSSTKTYAGPAYVEPEIAYNNKSKVTPEELNKLSCTLYHAYNPKDNTYSEPYDGESWKFSLYKELIPQFLSIMDDVCVYVKNNNYIGGIQIAGLGAGKSSNGVSFHAAGLAFDLNSSFKYSSNGTMYAPYSGQGSNTWNNYRKFVCEVCNGNEDCPQNVNYQIYHKYFEKNGWCWGGNWGLDSFDPMHIEYRKECYASNKMKVTC